MVNNVQPNQSVLFRLLVGDAIRAGVLHYSVVPGAASSATQPPRGSTMPYIEMSRRNSLQYHTLNELGFVAHNVGELTYLLYKIAKDYGLALGESSDYARRSEAIAALDNAKEEFRRRHLNPYEDQKREENGDV